MGLGVKAGSCVTDCPEGGYLLIDWTLVSQMLRQLSPFSASWLEALAPMSNQVPMLLFELSVVLQEELHGQHRSKLRLHSKNDMKESITYRTGGAAVCRGCICFEQGRF